MENSGRGEWDWAGMGRGQRLQWRSPIPVPARSHLPRPVLPLPWRFLGGRPGRRLLPLFELQLVQLRVHPLRLEQLAVASLLDDLPVMEDDDAVGALDGGEAVGDDDRGAAREKRPHG